MGCSHSSPADSANDSEPLDFTASLDLPPTVVTRPHARSDPTNNNSPTPTTATAASASTSAIPNSFPHRARRPQSLVLNSISVSAALQPPVITVEAAFHPTAQQNQNHGSKHRTSSVSPLPNHLHLHPTANGNESPSSPTPYYQDQIENFSLPPSPSPSARPDKKSSIQMFSLDQSAPFTPTHVSLDPALASITVKSTPDNLTPLISQSNSPMISPTTRPMNSEFSPLMLSLKRPSASGRSPSSRYEFLSELGRGHFGKVVKVRDTRTGIFYACKILDRTKLAKSQAVKHEIDCLIRLRQHPNIVSLVDKFEDDRKAYLILELMEGGDLFSRIVNEGRYSENQAKEACRQIAEGLKHIHSCGIVHRDLKPENLLLSGSRIALADFGLSKIVKSDDSIMKTVCGSRAYLAPEVILRRPYNSTVDNYTLGVLLFILLAGFHPFDVYGDLPEPELLRKIVDCKLDFSDPLWSSISENAKSLIQRLVVFDPNKRLSIDQFLASPWLNTESSNVSLAHVTDRLQRQPLAGRQLRALVMAKIASRRFKLSISRSPSLNSRRITSQPNQIEI